MVGTPASSPRLRQRLSSQPTTNPRQALVAPGKQKQDLSCSSPNQPTPESRRKVLTMDRERERRVLARATVKFCCAKDRGGGKKCGDVGISSPISTCGLLTYETSLYHGDTNYLLLLRMKFEIRARHRRIDASPGERCHLHGAGVRCRGESHRGQRKRVLSASLPGGSLTVGLLKRGGCGTSSCKFVRSLSKTTKTPSARLRGRAVFSSARRTNGAPACVVMVRYLCAQPSQSRR